jgi:corrinoid protein of di/trimethylamine methyltransferase
MATLDELVNAVMDGDEEEANAAAEKVVQEGVPITIVIDALTAGMREIGDQFARMEIFLPEMMMSAQAMKAAMAVLEPELQKAGAETEKKGTIVIGTVEGDMHEIGKDIVITLLQVQGFEVHDLGINVNALDFVNKAEEVKADIIGASSLMTTTMPNQRDIIEILKEKGIRDRYHVILGGAPVTQEWVDQCGADSWGENAGKAVALLERVMEERSK